jgi:hypothetical protein
MDISLISVGKILIEARHRFDVLTEPEVSNDPGNSDSPPTVPEELMHLFQSEIYESDDSDMPIVSVLPDLPPPPPNPSQTHQSEYLWQAMPMPMVEKSQKNMLDSLSPFQNFVYGHFLFCRRHDRDFVYTVTKEALRVSMYRVG